LMSGFAAGGEPGTGALAAMSKVVFSATLSEPLSWANTQLVAQDPVEAVREMNDLASHCTSWGRCAVSGLAWWSRCLGARIVACSSDISGAAGGPVGVAAA